VADFHNAAGQPVHLVRPPPTGRVYARRLDDDTEYTLPAGPRVVALADLAEAPPRVASRGAAHEAFSLIFSLPFERSEVDTYTERRETPPAPPTADATNAAASVTSIGRPVAPQPPTKRSATRTVLGWTSIAVGAAALGASAVLSASAIDVSHGTTAAASQATVASRDARITAFNTAAVAGYAAGGALVASGVLTLVWPQARHVQAAVLPQGGYVGATFGF
jgi:hypothetical protein